MLGKYKKKYIILVFINFMSQKKITAKFIIIF